MPRPITVYLDTSDFSRLADEKKTTDLHTILDELIRLRESGQVIFRYSIIHLMEYLKSEGSTLETSLRKTGLINQLCDNGLTAFRYPSSVWEREAHGLEEGRWSIDFAASETGEWFPEIDPEPEGANSFLEELERRVNQNPSLATFSSIFLENRRLSGLMQKEFERTFDNTPLSAKLPSQNDLTSKNFLLSMLRGEAGKREFYKKATEGVAQPNFFVANYFDNIESARRLFRNFGETEDQLYQKLVKFQKDMHQIDPSDNKGKFELLQGLKNSTWPYLGLKDPEMIKAIVSGEIHPILRSASAHIAACIAYLYHNFTPNKNLRKVRLSDPGDILHCTYLPYCQMFRTDAYFGSLIKRFAEKLGTQVITKLEELPSRITATLNTD